MGSGLVPVGNNKARTTPLNGGGGGSLSTGALGAAGGPQTPLFPPYSGAVYTPGASLIATGALIDAIAVIGGVAYYVKKNENGEVVEVGSPVDPAEQTYDDNGQAAAAPVDGDFYEGPESVRVQRSNEVAAQERAAQEAASAPAPAADGGGGATDAGYDGGGGGGGGGGGSSRRSSGGGGGGGGSSSGGGASAPAAMGFPFSGGFGSTPNTYPTLPMTPIRAKILGNLSGAFPNAGRFPTPPGGWREDMAPMFTTGAFGGASAPAPEAAPAAAPASSQMPSGGFAMPAMPGVGGIPGGPATGTTPAPSLPDPTSFPPEAMLGLAPPPTMAPTFSQPGFVAPGSVYDQQMQRTRQQPGGNVAPLPASLRQRFGL